jgi:NAD(P)-dependent dehydrogenase (short-subunit alcohol dehydrogenase family)
MKIQGSRVLVTGANRGLGRAFVEAFLQAGATKVYAGARDIAAMSRATGGAMTDPRIAPVQLDVTSAVDIDAALAQCADIDILVNNAGRMRMQPLLDPDTFELARAEMEVNYFGTLAMSRAFAPVLVKHGGGCIVNMLSVASWYTYAFNPAYCASKAAALAVTDGLRTELAPRGTQVVGVFAGFIDTDMAAHVSDTKVTPQEVASRTLAGIEAGCDEVFGDDISRALRETLNRDAASVRAEMARLYRESLQRGDALRATQG